MGSNFNPNILVDKLKKLNSSQQSIETLSHWCIFHMNKAKQVVETWARQFRGAPPEQRLAFLYLANDILQNSRRKGAEFVAEFWKVLPDSLRDVVENGDEFGRNAALRLISIWEERKVFGSRGQILKEEFVRRHLDNGSRNSKHAGPKLKSPGGNALDKLVSGYQAVHGSQLDEDSIVNKCRNAIRFVEKVDKDIEGDQKLSHVNVSHIADQLKGQNSILRDCIQQLTVVESSRADLVTLLREALQEQEYKLDQVRDQLQVAQTRVEQAEGICRQLLDGSLNEQILGDQSGLGDPAPQAPQNSIPGAGEQPASVVYTRQLSFPDMSGHFDEDPKSTAAVVAAKLTESTSSAQMLTYVLSSLASGVIGNCPKESAVEYPPEKRAKIENDHPSYVPQNPEQLQQNMEFPSSELNRNNEPPPPLASPPPLPALAPPLQPYLVPQYIQTVMPIQSGPFGYNMSQQPPAPTLSYAPSTNAYQSYPTESGFYGQPSSLPMAPMGRQQN